MPNTVPSRAQILRLYKHLIRYGNQLKLSNKTYVLTRIRGEFREPLKDPEEIALNFKKGETLLRKGLIV